METSGPGEEVHPLFRRAEASAVSKWAKTIRERSYRRAKGSIFILSPWTVDKVRAKQFPVGEVAVGRRDKLAFYLFYFFSLILPT